MIKLSMQEEVETTILWLTKNFSWLFDEWTSFVDAILTGISTVLFSVPWLVVALLLMLSAYVLEGFLASILTFLLLFIVKSFGFWDESITTISMILTCLALCLAFGFPLGILSAKNDWVEKLLRPILDAMQTIPAFVYLIPAVMFFGVGNVPGIMATIIFALPCTVRFTNLGIRQVPKNVVEAAKAFGANSRQILFKVELPLSLPTLMAGVTQTVMMSLAMVVTSSMIGAEGLGKPVLYAIQRVDVGLGAEAGFCILAIAIILDRQLRALTRKQEQLVNR